MGRGIVPAITVALLAASLSLPLASPLGPDHSDVPVSMATFLGGEDREVVRDMLVRADGSIVLVGNTGSLDLPVTPNAAQPLYGGLAGPLNGEFPQTREDGFVVSLDADGSPTYATYLGGASVDEVRAVGELPDGGLALAGITFSDDFPTTDGAIQTERGGDFDGFVARLNPDGSLAWSTYIGGGPAEEGEDPWLSRDWIEDLAVAQDGSILVTGHTISPGFPTTPGAVQTSLADRVDHAFVSKFTPDGALAWSTLLGGAIAPNGLEGDTQAKAIHVDTGGTILVAGQTESRGFPTTEGAFQEEHATVSNPIPDNLDATYADAFISRLTGDGSTLQASTYLGGALAVERYDDDGDLIGITQPDERIFDLDLAPDGAVVVAGSANSLDLPGTTGAAQPQLNDDPEGPLLSGGEGFVARMSGDLSTLHWASYLGGESSDITLALDVDGDGRAHVLSQTLSLTFPTQDPWQAQLSDHEDHDLVTGLGCQEPVPSLLDPFTSSETPCADLAWRVTKRSTDAAYTVLSADGSAFERSTYLGGDGGDSPGSIFIDDAGQITIGMTTLSRELPVRGLGQPVNRGGIDGYVLRAAVGGGCPLAAGPLCTP